MLRFAVLGPLIVQDPIGTLSLAGAKERALLCLLLARANHIVPVDDLIQGLWGDEPPPTAEKSLQAHVVRLRDALEPDRPRGQSGSLIFTVEPGYLLRCDPEALDMHQFERLVADGQQALAAGAASTASRHLGEALSLWRGRPFGEYESELLDRERTRLTELERAARRDRAQAELDLGRHHQLIPDLEHDVAADPTDERAWAHLMLALYRDDRQGDALAVFHRAREALGDELGIEPGDELQHLQSQMLDQDPALLEGIGRRGVQSLPVELRTGDGPFVDRQAELATLAAIWESVQEQSGLERSVVLLRGEDGMGKTRLVAEFVKSIGPKSAVIYASCQPETSEPLAIFDRLAAAVGRPELSPTRGSSDFTPRSLGSAVARLTADDNVVLVLEDLDLTAEWSRTALRGLLEGLGSGRGLVVVTTQDQVAERPREVSEEVRLNALGLGDTVAIVAAFTGEESASLAAADIHPMAKGNPGRVRTEAAAWARRQAQTDIQVAAARAAAEREVLGRTRVELRDRIAGYQTLVAPLSPDDQLASAPYKGLAPFGIEDAAIFFGREQLVGRLAGHLAENPLLVLVGPSGSGKSSLARAGLMSALAAGLLPGSDQWQLRTIDVGRLDCSALDTALDELSAPAMGRKVSHQLVLVDQLEQIFGRCDHTGHGLSFLDRLADLAAAPGRTTAVVATLRSDYFGRLADSPTFAAAAADASEVIGPMTVEELQRAIELPAQRAGLRLESGLAAAIAADAHGKPGALPLLSTALLELWEQRNGTTLTWTAYRRSGGLAGAVARLAEDAFGRLNGDEQEVARRILLRTVGAGEDMREVGRRVPLAELAGEGEAGDDVLATLAERRLVAVDESAVEVTHEALYQEWPRLRGWLDEDRRGREIQRRLITAAREWEERGREQSDLYRGIRLASARAWQEEHARELNELEGAFLQASSDLEERQAAADRERTRLTLRANRRLRFAAVGLAVLVGVSAVVGGVAVSQSQAAGREATAATAARLGATALVDPNVDRELLLAAAAYELDNSIDTRGALLASLLRSPQTIGVIHGAPNERLLDTAVSPDGRLVGIGTNTGMIAVWDWPTRTRLALLDAGVEVFDMAFSNDGASIMAAQPSGDGWHIRRWTVPDFTELPDLVIPGRAVDNGAIQGAAFAKAAAKAAALMEDGAVVTIDLDTGAQQEVASRPSGEPPSVGISDDGERIAVATETDVQVMDSAGTVLSTFDLVENRVKAPVIKMFFSADGKRLALAADDGTVHLIDPVAGTEVARASLHTESIKDLAITPDGRTVVSAGDDGVVVRWLPDLGYIERFNRGHSGRVFGVAIAPGGQTVFSAGADNALLAWDLSGKRRFGEQLAQLPSNAWAWASSDDGSKVAMAYEDGTVAVADLAAGTTWQINAGVGPLWSVQFDHTGGVIATAGEQGWIAFLDAASGAPVAEPIDGHGYGIGSLRFSPDNGMLAAADDDSAWVVDLTTRSAGPQLFKGDTGISMSWSPDGRNLAVGTRAGLAIIFDAESRVEQRRLHVDAKSTNQVRWSPDGSRLATGSASGLVQLWSTSDWSKVGQEIRAHGNEVTDVKWSADGRWLATFGGDGAASVWDTATGRQLAPLVGAPNIYGGLWLAPDGMRVISYETDGSIWSWPLDDATLLSDVCSIAGRDLTADEWQTYAPGVPPKPICLAPTE